MKNVPLRRCLGCMESKPKRDLCRIVKTKENEISIDKIGRKQGRGAYICYSKECLNKAIKSKRLEKEFEVTIPESIYDELLNDII